LHGLFCPSATLALLILFFVIVFAPPLMQHIAFSFSIENDFIGKKEKAKSCPDTRDKNLGQKIKPKAIFT
jgi:hypothetical protein